jgi:hypothetical protein
MTRRKKLSGDFEKDCRKIVMDNMQHVEAWLTRLGKRDPEAALRAWVNIAEFVEAKKPRDNKQVPSTTINILMQPASRKKLEAAPDDYLDITDAQNTEGQIE